jgi:hypothetical protein
MMIAFAFPTRRFEAPAPYISPFTRMKSAGAGALVVNVVCATLAGKFVAKADHVPRARGGAKVAGSGGFARGKCSIKAGMTRF